MKKGFNLSERRWINQAVEGSNVYWEEDVKEFIKKLKEEFGIHLGKNDVKAFSSNQINFEIDKLAGDELI